MIFVCFISICCCATRPMSSSCRFLEISLIKWFRFTFFYRKLICGMEMSLLSRSSSFSSEGLYSLSISADLSSNKSGLTVFLQLHKESTTWTYVARIDSIFILYFMFDLFYCVLWKDIHSKKTAISGFKIIFHFSFSRVLNTPLLLMLIPT